MWESRNIFFFRPGYYILVVCCSKLSGKKLKKNPPKWWWPIHHQISASFNTLIFKVLNLYPASPEPSRVSLLFPIHLPIPKQIIQSSNKTHSGGWRLTCPRWHNGLPKTPVILISSWHKSTALCLCTNWQLFSYFYYVCMPGLVCVIWLLLEIVCFRFLCSFPGFVFCILRYSHVILACPRDLSVYSQSTTRLPRLMFKRFLLRFSVKLI